MRVVMYLRISSEDTDKRETGKAESNSIAHQRWLLADFVRNHPDLCDAELDELCDDGWSGKNFERPGMIELMEQVKRGTVQCIVVKDFSRFGRDYLTVGNYISRVFPFMGVRFISVNDSFDSSRPGDIDSLDTSFKTLIYDLYSRELSQKVKAARKHRAEQGLFLSPFAPYGYAKDENDKNHLVIDEPAAEVVRRIFQMALDGCPNTQIAAALNREGVGLSNILDNELRWRGPG
jgi:DNA invertase Pin-like site-specific DNA recombinase